MASSLTFVLSIFSFKILPGHASVLQGWLSDPNPGQFAPPFAGAGLSHVLVLVWVPPPQSAEQVPYEPQLLQSPSTVILFLKKILAKLLRILPGHASVLQGWLSDPKSGQFAPPLAGAGLSHALVLVWVPPPQSAEQVPNALQLPQTPSTANARKLGLSQSELLNYVLSSLFLPPADWMQMRYSCLVHWIAWVRMADGFSTSSTVQL